MVDTIDTCGQASARKVPTLQKNFPFLSGYGVMVAQQVRDTLEGRVGIQMAGEGSNPSFRSTNN